MYKVNVEEKNERLFIPVRKVLDLSLQLTLLL